jgi:peptidyl-prolyl cis-trans isomerase A (cyclophilin A)
MILRQSGIVGVVIAGAALAAAGVAAQVDLSKVARLRSPATLTEQAPATFRANFDTTKGAFVVEVTRDWAPLGADRFYNLVKNGFYDEVRFFRVIPGFMAQFGLHGNPAVNKAWSNQVMKDDPVKQGNQRGYVTFAHRGPNTRTTQLFINFRDNGASLNKQGFAAFGQIVSGMDVVDKLHSGYGEIYDRRDFELSRFESEGNAYLAKQFPQLDYIKSATIAK